MEKNIFQHDDVLERQGPRGVNWQTNRHPVDKQFRSGYSEKYNSLAEQKFTPKLYQHQSVHFLLTIRILLVIHIVSILSFF